MVWYCSIYCYAKLWKRVMNDEVVILNQIYKTCMDTSLTEQEAISIIAGLIEERLADYGLVADPYNYEA